VYLLTRERDPDKATEIEAWIDQVAQTWNVLSLDGRTLRTWAKLMHRQQDHLMADALIAATAIVNNLIVVTRNEKDFEVFGVRIFNPFEGRGKHQ
jgi:toxin FitB